MIISLTATGRQFDDKARAARMIVLDPDAPFVVGDDVAHYRKPKTCASVARRKFRQEQFIAVARVDAVTLCRRRSIALHRWLSESSFQLRSVSHKII